MAAPVLAQTAGTIEIAETEVEVGASFGVTVTDSDLNTDPGNAETVDVTLTSDNATTAESETISLLETGVDTGIFAADVTVTDGSGGITTGNDVVEAVSGDVITVTYTDANPAATPSDTITVVEPVTGPGAFELIFPPNGFTTEVGTLPAPLGITWEESDGATHYNWRIWAGTDTTVAPTLEIDGTAAADADDITCDSTAMECTLTIADPNVVLTAAGTYTWDVVAADGEDFTTANTTESTSDFTFTLTEPIPVGPADFTLLGPGSEFFPGPVLRDELAAGVIDVTWNASTGADTYTFSLFQISENNTRLIDPVVLSGLTPEPEDDALTCATDTASNSEVCTLAIDVSVLTSGALTALPDGLYSWTVVAFNEEGETEASNAPLFFEVQTDAIVLLDEGFEGYDSNQPTPDWIVRRNTGGDRIRCNNENNTFSNTGECAYQVRDRNNTPNLLVRYVWRLEDLAEYNLQTGDTLNLSAFLRTFGGNEGANAVRLFVRYGNTDADGKKIREDVWLELPAVADPGAYEEVTDSIALQFSNVELIRVDIRENFLSGGRFWIDDILLTLVPPPAPTPPPPAPLPLPLPAPAN